ncbi:BUB3-interacting and GLEBS motif-containing protein [Oopsacas minuta]|uniref:BUB3-interacting and GLEBS motif-containing protein n=1 Tax=Oopsacas minuta TaxID=111878 RepID=A0AAV7KAU8_9METZ|nr:BUB3-interacting and GLEBS motif-containing protein [Oopsacas minuta]
MGRKRKKILKPWCWYCEREFEEEKVLIHHQKSKHFKCQYCQKKLYTGPGLVIHCSQVHKETVTEIPNAFPHRNNLEMDIYGTEGIPEKDRLERERNRGAGDDPKRYKQETGIAFVPAPPGMIPMMSGIPMMPPGHHGAVPLPMMSPQFGMVPPMPVGAMPAPPLPGRPMFPSGMQGGIHSSTEPGHPALPPPLFPSGSISADIPPAPARQPSNRKNVGYAVALNENATLMHPDNEISMEELRAMLPRYQSQHLIPRQPLPFTPPAQGEFQGAPLLYSRQDYPPPRHMHMSHSYKQY